MRRHWENCIANFDDQVEEFVSDYFGDGRRRVLLVAAAGFDPRSVRIAQMLSNVLGDRLSALFFREERPRPSAALLEQADRNERALRELVPDSRIVEVQIFADDNAPIGGSNVAKLLAKHPVADDVTDVILDMSALSIGVGFPAALMLLEDCEAASDRAFHLMIASNPELDDRIASTPWSRPSTVRGFAPALGEDEDLDVAQI